MQTEIEKPQTSADLAKSIRRENAKAEVFVLFHNGLGSPIASVGRSYEEMWRNGEQATGATRQELLMKSYVFDVMSAEDAVRQLG